MMIIRPSIKIKTVFLHYLAQSDLWRKQLSLYSYGSAQQQLSRKILRNIYLVLPSVGAQKEIVAHLDRELAIIDNAVHSTSEGIALLQKYKSSLIAAVVTGKLDVRGAAAALPEVDPLPAEDDLDEAFAADDSEFDNEELAEAAD